MPEATPNYALARPSWWEWLGLGVLVVGLLLFSIVVEMRSAFMERRMTDLDVYLRAAWAVRAGEDLYTVTDDNSWHYHYPPLFAIALTPLADPPEDFDRNGMPSFAVSVAIWYGISLLCLAWAAHLLASAIEQTSSDPAVRGQPPGCRRWWALRIVPVVICLPPIGH